MRVRWVAGLILVAAVWIGDTSVARAEGVPVFAGKPKTLLESRGLPMSSQEALQRITFHPYVPVKSYLEVALLPPFHGDDKDVPENRGIGYEYVRNGRTFVIRQWPRAGGTLGSYAAMPGVPGCSDVHVAAGTLRHIDGIAWATANFVFALQLDTDEKDDPRAVRSEWLRLVARGACR